VGLPIRIAAPIIVVFSALFLGIMGYFLFKGFGATGTMRMRRSSATRV
jgi:hypothetical protein